MNAAESGPARCGAVLLVLAMVVAAMLTGLGTLSQARAATDPVAERDANCGAINTWLADHQYPERVDCTTLSTDPEQFCTDVDRAFTSDGIDATYDCATGTITPVTGPGHGGDAVCARVNGWLADHQYPERIDCALSTDPGKVCAAVNRTLASVGVSYDCATGTIIGAPPPTGDPGHGQKPCPEEQGARGKGGQKGMQIGWHIGPLPGNPTISLAGATRP